MQAAYNYIIIIICNLQPSQCFTIFTIFSLLLQYDVFLFVITTIATDIVKGIGKVQKQKE